MISMVQRARYLQGGAGPRTVIFLHGVGTDAEAWTPQLAFFAPKYRAIAWNMPGYGGTPALLRLTFPALAQRLHDFLSEQDIPTIDLVGHSYGGMAALEFAASFPDRLRTLTLSGTSPAFGRPDGEWQKKFVADRLAPIDAGKTMEDLAPDMVCSLTGPNPDQTGVEIAVRAIASVPVATFASGIRNIVTFDRRDALPKLTVPTLVLAGELDTNAPAPMMEKMAEKIPGSQYVCLPGVGHLGNLENPGAFNQALDTFLAAH
jgi:3-oxoadipate enol-lactonase